MVVLYLTFEGVTSKVPGSSGLPRRDLHRSSAPHREGKKWGLSGLLMWL